MVGCEGIFRAMRLFNRDGGGEEATALLLGARRRLHSHAAERAEALHHAHRGAQTLFWTRSDVIFVPVGNWMACICGFEITFFCGAQ